MTKSLTSPPFSHLILYHLNTLPPCPWEFLVAVYLCMCVLHGIRATKFYKFEIGLAEGILVLRTLQDVDPGIGSLKGGGT